MSDHIRIRKADGKWTVRAGGAVLVESSNALELNEGKLDPVIYFPRDDIAMALLEPTTRSTHCPHKGDASYFSIITPANTLEDAAWSYETRGILLHGSGHRRAALNGLAVLFFCRGGQRAVVGLQGINVEQRAPKLGRGVLSGEADNRQEGGTCLIKHR